MIDDIFKQVMANHTKRKSTNTQEETKKTFYTPVEGDIVVGYDDYSQPSFFKVIGATKKCFKIESLQYKYIYDKTKTLLEPGESTTKTFLARLPKNTNIWRVCLNKGNYRYLRKKYNDGDIIYYNDRPEL